MRTLLVTALALASLCPAAALAQSGDQQAPPTQPASAAKVPDPNAEQPAAKAVIPGPTVATDASYTIGPEDVLGVVFWRDQDMTGDVTVRPDGMITLPLLRDIKAAGFTPNQLADRIQEAAREYITDASVTVVVRQLNSRKVFITGEVAHPGAYPLKDRMTVLQLIALAGGLTEFAAQKDITIMRADAGGTAQPGDGPVTFRFNYRDVAARRNVQQNIELKPGDTVVVPEK
jgi:polysaccharide export outer membrane protein